VIETFEGMYVLIFEVETIIKIESAVSNTDISH